MSLHKGDILVEGPISFSEKTDGSGNTIRTFIGTEAQIRSTQINLRALGWETTVEQLGQGLAWKLTATFAFSLLNQNEGQEPEPEALWTVQGLASEQNIMESDIFLVQGMSTETKELILKAVKNPGKGYPIFGLNNTTQDERAKAKVLFNLMTLGADHKRLNTVAVSRTIQVSRRYISTWSNANVNKVLSKSALISSTSMPAWVSVLIPESQYQVNIGKTGLEAIYINRGYLMEHPSYHNVADSKVEISQSWLYGDWVFEYYTFV